MIIYLLAALFLFYVYYFAERYIVKRSLLKAGGRVAEFIKTSTNPGNNDFKNLRKNTDYFIYRFDKPAFLSLTSNTPDLLLKDLDYCDLVRFKNIFEDFQNNKTSDSEFFAHKKFRHLVYPFLSKHNKVEIILLQTENSVVDDFFNRSPK